MIINEGAKLEVTCNNRRVTGTLVKIYQNTDGSEDYMIDIIDERNDEVLFLPINNIIRVIKEGIDITRIKKGSILEVKKSQDSKSYTATVLDVSYDNPNEYHIRIKNNRTEKIENIRLLDIIKIISP